MFTINQPIIKEDKIMANTKFYYNGQVVRTSATKTYTHAVLVADTKCGTITLEDGRTARMVGCCGRPDLVPSKVKEAEKMGFKEIVVVELTTEAPVKSTKKSSKKPAKDYTVVDVVIYTFTGMKIQKTRQAELENDIYLVPTNKGVLKFDAKTLKQLGCKNPKFANRIELV